MKHSDVPFKLFKPNKSELAAPPALPFTLAASLKGYIIWVGLVRPVLAVLLLGLLFWSNPWYGLTALAFIVVLLTVAGLALKQRRLHLTEKTVQYRNAWGKTTEISYSEIKAVRVFVNYLDAGFGVMPRVFIEKNDGTRFAMLNPLFWPVDDIDRVLSVFRAKKIDVPYYDEILQQSQVYEHLPGLSTYAERHTGRLGIAIGLGIFAVIIVFVALTR